MITSLWLLVACPWELRSQPYKPGATDLSQNKSQETGLWTVLCPPKPSQCTAPPPILPPYPIPPTARHPRPALPSTPSSIPTHREQLKETLAAHPERDPGWIPAPRSHAATVGCSDSPTAPRLALLLGCLKVPVADASLMSAFISVLLKT